MPCIERYLSARDYAAAALGFLSRDEARNHLFAAVATSDAPHPDTLMLTIADNGDVVAAVQMVPGKPLQISDDALPAAVEALAEYLRRAGVQVTAAVSTPETIGLFVRCWTTAAPESLVTKPLILHRLDRVIPPAPVPGSFREAGASDIARLTEFFDAFMRGTGEPHPNPRQRIEERLRLRELFVWEAGGLVVSMAGRTRPTPSGCAINAVYTPPEFRGNGYASNCVAALSQHLLDSGKTFLTLYTDPANPTSNAIYRAIGYTPISTIKEIRFQHDEPPSTQSTVEKHTPP